jgi:hypothetical protein
VEEHKVVCQWIRQFLTSHEKEIKPQDDDVVDGSRRRRARPPKQLKKK